VCTIDFTAHAYYRKEWEYKRKHFLGAAKVTRIGVGDRFANMTILSSTILFTEKVMHILNMKCFISGYC